MINNMTRLIIPALVALMALAVSACSTESNIDQLVRDGDIRLDTSENPDVDFKLHIRNAVFLDGMWDGRQEKDRQIAAEYVLGPQCPNMKKVGEDVIKLGNNLTFGGGPALEYITKWKCRR